LWLWASQDIRDAGIGVGIGVGVPGGVPEKGIEIKRHELDKWDIDTIAQTAYNLGFAQGERTGAQNAVSAIEQIVWERKGLEAAQADVDLVRKKLLH